MGNGKHGRTVSGNERELGASGSRGLTATIDTATSETMASHLCPSSAVRRAMGTEERGERREKWRRLCATGGLGTEASVEVMCLLELTGILVLIPRSIPMMPFLVAVY